MFGLGLSNLPYILLVVIPVGVMAVTVHEVAHGYAAYRLGDPTAANEGRLTLNPIRHIDPIGALMIVLIGFGWARPVPVNPYYFRKPMKGMMWVALAGPASNLVLAIACALMLRGVLFLPGDVVQPLFRFFQFGIIINVVLAAFNMIPVPPLDGSRLVAYLLPRDLSEKYQEIERLGFLPIVVVIFVLPWATNGRLDIVRAVSRAALTLFYAVMF